MANENNNTNLNDKSFGQWLKQQRNVLHLTQEDLAMRINVGWEFVRKMESGARRPSKQVAELLADGLRISPEQRPAFERFARFGEGAEHFLSMREVVPEPSNVPNNLPSGRTTFIGRESLIASVCALLQRPAVRLLTLTGPAGIGKTRLSQQVAGELLEEFPGGVYFAPLAPVTDHDFVAPAIVQTLGVALSPDQPAVRRLKEYLRDRHMLLVLDNFEQVVQAGPLVAELLDACPKLKIMVTSRAVLQVYGEHEFPVQPMVLPGKAHLSTLEVLEQNEAVELFIQRSEAVKPDFALTEENAPSVVEICHRLDGLPLAIELAAARSNILSPQAIVSRLGNRLNLLTVGSQDQPARQRTLRSAIAWSYELLDDEEKALFARMGVFVGGCTLEAAEAVAGDVGLVGILDAMASLVGKSLLQEEEGEGGEPRFWMLETIREYALEKLEACGEVGGIQRRHTAYYLELAERAELKLTSAERAEWLARLDRELDNIRAVLTRCLSRHGDVESGLRLAGALGWFWYFRSYFTEGRLWMEEAVKELSSLRNTVVGAKILGVAGRLALRQNDYVAARAWLEQSISIWEKTGATRELAHALSDLAAVVNDLGEVTLGHSLIEQAVALFRELHDDWNLAFSLDRLGDAESWIDGSDRATALYQESLDLFRKLGDKEGIAAELRELGGMAMGRGDWAAAIGLLEEALGIETQIGNKWNAALLIYALGYTELLRGDYQSAGELYGEALVLFKELSIRQAIAGCLRNLGYIAQLGNDYERAASLYKEYLALAPEFESAYSILLCLSAISGLLASLGRFVQAATLMGTTEALRARTKLELRGVDCDFYERGSATLRSALDTGTLSKAQACGSVMTTREAIAYAQESLTESAS